MQPSIELVSAILSKKVKLVEPEQYNMLNIMFNSIDGRLINLHEFAHRCKEWVMSRNGFYAVWYDVDFKSFQCSITNEITCFVDDDSFQADTEPEAIFKACQWILDNK